MKATSGTPRQSAATAPASATTIAGLVALVTRLADQLDAMPSAGLDHDRDRRARAKVLRQAAEAGTRTLTVIARADRANGQHHAR